MTKSYKLDPERHESIYTDKIAARYLPKSKPQEQPHAIITGGQPGAGKSGITANAIERFRESGYVLVDADKLRPYHPDYMRLMRENDRIAANLTHADCGSWATRLLRDGVEGRRNIIIDQTSRDFDALARTAQGLRQAGYTVELHAMAVSSAVSEQRIYQRYEGQREKDGFGRFSTKDKHDEAYAGVAKTVALVEQRRQVDRVCLYDHGIKPIYENWLEGNQWQNEPRGQEALEAERARPMTLQERRDYAKGFDELADMLAKPERQASAEEIRKIADLHREAKVALATEVFRRSLSKGSGQTTVSTPAPKAKNKGLRR
jgi:predicted ABC-type ATPase